MPLLPVPMQPPPRPTMPIAIVMRQRPPSHAWDEPRWSAAAVLPWHDTRPAAVRLEGASGGACMVTGLQLELHPDENDGYFENWVAPEPKVFVLWHPLPDPGVPVAASVSYSEGARMLDSGDCADGLPMAREIHDWLATYLTASYRPRTRRGHHHG
jgi:hypothetical protein